MNVDLEWLQQQFPQISNIAVLSRGGQKIVFAATHISLGEIVLKLIHPSEGEQSVTRERLAVDQVQSKRVPRILDFGCIQTNIGACYWFMEQRIFGRTLRGMIDVSCLGYSEVLKLGAHILESLTKAEQAKIVHRDIKPENIICDVEGDFWLLDFGIARHLTLSALTDISARWGKFTPGYAPPEQFRNIQNEIDVRADLFALGVTLYESLTGKNPYWIDSDDALQVLRKVEMTIPPPIGPTLAAKPFSDLVATCMQRRRDHRPRSAQDTQDWLLEISQSTH